MLLTLYKSVGPSISQWLSSNHVYFETFLNSTINSAFNSIIINSTSSLTNWIPTITAPELYNHNNYYDDQGIFIATIVILLICTGLIFDSASFVMPSIKGIAWGMGFNLIYFITSFFYSDIWLLINTVMAIIFRGALSSDTKDATKADMGGFSNWLSGVFTTLMIITSLEIIIKYIYYIIVLVLYHILSFLQFMMKCLSSTLN